MQKLIDYKRFRNAADILSSMALQRSRHFKRDITISKVSNDINEGA